jgi:hypothetical protein
VDIILCMFCIKSTRTLIALHTPNRLILFDVFIKRFCDYCIFVFVFVLYLSAVFRCFSGPLYVFVILSLLLVINNDVYYA